MLGIATRRLRDSEAKTIEKAELDLLELVPHVRWIHFNYQFTVFGRKACTARHLCCAECPLEAIAESLEQTV